MMHPDQLTVTTGMVRALVAEQFPAWAGLPTDRLVALVRLPNGAELPAGAYYYHPLRHELQLIAHLPSFSAASRLRPTLLAYFRPNRCRYLYGDFNIVWRWLNCLMRPATIF